MAMPNTLDICRKHFMSDVSSMKQDNVPDIIIDRILRMRAVYGLWVKTPSLLKRDLVEVLTSQYGIRESQAYEDLKIVDVMVGDMNDNSKAFHRYRFTSGIMKAIELAEKKKDLKALGVLWDKYAKYHKLDQEDINEVEWGEKVINPFLRLELDASAIGFKKIPNLLKKIPQLEKKFLPRIEEFEQEKEELEVGYED